MHTFAYIFQYGIQAEIVHTSSLKSGINLIGDSDIDITMLVEGCTDGLKEQVEKMLVDFDFDFVYQGQVYGYHLFSQKTSEIEFEVKLRERAPAIPIIQLHHRMDSLSQEEKTVITYGKLLFHGSQYYDMFKMLVYNMYFADIEGCYLLE